VTNTKRPYTGFDKIGTETHPAAKKLSELLTKRFGVTYMGGLVVRVMRSAPAAIQKLDVTNPANAAKVKPYMSVHASGRGVDTGSQDPKVLEAVFNFLVDNADELFIEEAHQYNHKGKGATKAWGRGFRCSRSGGKDRGIKEWNAQDNGGTPGGLWIHYEVSPQADAATLEKNFRAIPKS
jgi:hypothetical protein